MNVNWEKIHSIILSVTCHGLRNFAPAHTHPLKTICEFSKPYKLLFSELELLIKCNHKIRVQECYGGRAMSCPWTWGGGGIWGAPFGRHAALWLFHFFIYSSLDFSELEITPVASILNQFWQKRMHFKAENLLFPTMYNLWGCMVIYLWITKNNDQILQFRSFFAKHL